MVIARKVLNPFRIIAGIKILPGHLVIVKPTLEEPETFSATRWLMVNRIETPSSDRLPSWGLHNLWR